MDGFEHLRILLIWFRLPIPLWRCHSQSGFTKTPAEQHQDFFGFFSFIATPSACRGRDAGWCCSTGLFLMVHIVAPVSQQVPVSLIHQNGCSLPEAQGLLIKYCGLELVDQSKWLQELCSFLIKFWGGWHLLTAYLAKAYSPHNFLPCPILSPVVCSALNLQVLSGLRSSSTWALRGIKTSHFSWV